MSKKIIKIKSYNEKVMQDFITWAKHQEDLDYAEYNTWGITEDLGSDYTIVIEAAKEYVKQLEKEAKEG